MVRGDLIALVSSLSSQGYTPDQVYDELSNRGYSPSDLNEALAASGIKKSKVPAIAIILVLVIALAASGIYFQFYYNPKPAQLLDVSLEPVKSIIDPGTPVDFIIQLVNLGSSSRYDVSIRSSLISVSSNEVLASKTETVAIETRAAIRSQLLMPQDARPGTYVVRSVVTYGSQSASGSFSVKVSPSIRTNLSKPFIEPLKCANECNDFDVCTRDSCVQGQCSFIRITPCCGNSLCEAQETPDSCPDDCQVARPMGESVQLITNKAVQAAQSNPESGSKLCKTLSQLSDQDPCLAQVAKKAGQPDICQRIITEKVRDGCYLDFALDRDRFDLCDKVVDRWLKSSCFSYSNLKQVS